MPRRPRPTASTLIGFIPVDDTAIGGDDETLAERYRQYVESADQAHLELDPEVTPDKYWLRPLNTRQFQQLMDLFSSAGELSGDADERMKASLLDELFGDEDFQQAQGMLFKDIVRRSLAGADLHIEVKEILPDGSFDIQEFSWKPGQPAPRGAVESVLNDENLVANMVNFLIAASTLTERQKNL